MANDIRKPKIGEPVAAIGRTGAFTVANIYDHSRTADLELVQKGTLLNNVPWTALRHISGE